MLSMAVPETAPRTAVIVGEPAVRVVARPFLSIEALLSEEDQVTPGRLFCVLPSLYVPTTVNV